MSEYADWPISELAEHIAAARAEASRLGMLARDERDPERQAALRRHSRHNHIRAQRYAAELARRSG